MIGRGREFRKAKEIVNKLLKFMPNVYMYKDQTKIFNEVILIRGALGSGKSLFIRKLLYEFIEYKEFKEIKYNTLFYFKS